MVHVFEEMIGRTLTKASRTEINGGDLLIFCDEEGYTYQFLHHQDCCESVYIEDISGDLTDLIGSPIVTAEQVDYDPPAREPGAYVPDSETWTFYRFGTAKGFVTVRRYGSSNGFYSESVSFECISPYSAQVISRW